MTAGDVHPPLYYLWLKAFTSVFPGAWHQASVCAYAATLIIILTWFRGRFGSWATAIMMTLCTLTYTAAKYAVEVRMYYLAAMWVFISFLALYDALRTNRWRYYIVMAIASLAAAYTHYYALISVAMLWLYLVIRVVATRKGIWKVIVCGIAAVVAFLPWMHTLFLAVGKKRR